MKRLTANELFFAATNGVRSRAELVKSRMDWMAMDANGDVFTFDSEPDRDEDGEWLGSAGWNCAYVGNVYQSVPGNSPHSEYAIKIDSSFLDDYEIDGKLINASDKYESEGDAF